MNPKSDLFFMFSYKSRVDNRKSADKNKKLNRRVKYENEMIETTHCHMSI